MDKSKRKGENVPVARSNFGKDALNMTPDFRLANLDHVVVCSDDVELSVTPTRMRSADVEPWIPSAVNSMTGGVMTESRSNASNKPDLKAVARAATAVRLSILVETAG